MSWSVVKSFENWRDLINLMIESSKKFVVFDIRVANVDSEIFDEKICWADYGGIKGPIILLNYNSLKKFLISKKNIIQEWRLSLMKVNGVILFILKKNLIQRHSF